MYVPYNNLCWKGCRYYYWDAVMMINPVMLVIGHEVDES